MPSNETLRQIIDDPATSDSERREAQRELGSLRPQSPPPEQKTPMEILESEWMDFSGGREWKFFEFCEKNNIRGAAYEAFKDRFKPHKSTLPPELRTLLSGGDPQSYFERWKKRYVDWSGDPNEDYRCHVILIEHALRGIIDTALNGCVDGQNYLASLRGRVGGFERLVIDKFYPPNTE